jgi:hypothetical protein
MQSSATRVAVAVKQMFAWVNLGAKSTMLLELRMWEITNSPHLNISYKSLVRSGCSSNMIRLHVSLS